MIIFDALFFNRELLELLAALGVRPEDCKYIDLYAEYVRMRRNGEKVTYVVTFLSEKYNVSVRKVYSLLKKFSRECDCIAVE